MRDYYLVAEDRSARVGDPGTKVYGEDFEEVTVDDIKAYGGPARIIILTPEQFGVSRQFHEQGTKITWKDPE